MRSYRKDYPRPQFVRESWENLNGEWQFAFDDAREGVAKEWFKDFPDGRSILVPFTYETKKSGIGDESFHPVVWYRRVIKLRHDSGRRVFLHFEGSDYTTSLWVNGQYAGCHSGGYTRFSFDITDLLIDGENCVTVRAEDSDDTMQPRGKQRWKDVSFGCWYVRTTGIWKTVWLEYVPVCHLENVRMTPLVTERMLELEWSVNALPCLNDGTLTAEISFEGEPVNSISIPVRASRGKTRINVDSVNLTEWGLKLWWPSEPNLYDIRFTLSRDGEKLDVVDSYFGMRSIRIDGAHILLNEVPIYQRLVLDQGYWAESGLTPPDEDALIQDIERTLELGFNGVRKHQKIEDERYAYWCDVKGLLQWCEMPSPYDFGDDMVQNFTGEWQAVVKQYYNHPSVITWTPLNESWGVPYVKTVRQQQHFTEMVYHLTKSMDMLRPVIVNDGWEHTISDIITLHDYEELGEMFLERYKEQKDAILSNKVYHCKAKSAFSDGYEYHGQPVIISEYGGAAFSGGARGTWGYGNTVSDTEQYIWRIKDMTQAILRLDWVCGYCYTQLTDVQQEINGLMDESRAYKADVKLLHEIFSKRPK